MSKLIKGIQTINITGHSPVKLVFPAGKLPIRLNFEKPTLSGQWFWPWHFKAKITAIVKHELFPVLVKESSCKIIPVRDSCTRQRAGNTKAKLKALPWCSLGPAIEQ